MRFASCYNINMRYTVIFFLCAALLTGGAPLSFAGGKKLVKGAKALSRSSAGSAMSRMGGAGIEKALGEQVMQSLWRESASAASEKLMLGAGRSAVLAQAASVQGREEIFRQMAPSLVQVIHPVNESVLSSGFVFEEKGVLWAAVPYHVAGRAGNKMMLRLFRRDGSSVKYKVEVFVAGGYGFTSADLSLCRLPEYARTHVTPLKLSARPVRPGDVLNGFGFVVDDFLGTSKVMFNVLPHLRVSAAGDYNMVAPLPNVSVLSGSCGSPYLNKEGEVAAVHSGSFGMRTINAVQAAAGIRDLLAAAQGTRPVRRVAWRGHKVAEVSVWESVGKIRVLRNGSPILDKDMHHYRGAVSYGRLEELIQAVAGDEVIIEIVTHRDSKRIVKFVVP